MATLNEIAYNIKNIASNGRASDDFDISLSQIKLWVIYHRNKILLEVTNNGKFIPLQVEQDLGTIPLIKVDKADAQGVVWGENIYKVNYVSTKTGAILPEFLKFNNRRGVTFVGLVDKVTPIPLIDEHNAFLTKHNKFAKNHRRGYFVGKELYIVLPTDFEMAYINVRGILQDPRMGVKINGTATSFQYDDDATQFPFPDEHLPVLVDRVLKSELSFTLKVPQDNFNNGVEDFSVGTKNVGK
tara:strand:+ start:2676 stop:3401 length:726 start_codon:yes stop_codon:yes gene_type:complete